MEDDILEYLSEREKHKLGKVVKDKEASNSELTSREVHDLFTTAQRRCMDEDRKRREASNLRDDTIDVFRNRMYSLKDKILKNAEEVGSVLKELCQKGESFLADSEARFDQLMNVALPILRKAKENSYITESYHRLPLSDGTKVFSIPFDMDSALATNGKSLCTEIEKELLVSCINGLWIKFINEVNNESLEPKDFIGIFDVNRMKMLDKIKKQLASLFIPINAIKNIEIEKKEENTIPVLKYFNNGRRVVEMTDLCPCGSGKLYWRCHGAQKLLN